MEADQGNDADDPTEGQQQQASSSQAGRPPPILPTSQLNLIFAKATEGLTERQL
jgi:hypothetical protein